MAQSENPIPVVTIDGPSGSGKGTVAAIVAERLGWHLLDSGALYRLLALAARRQGLSPEDEAGLVPLAAGLDVEFRGGAPGESTIFLSGEDVTRAIRTERVGNDASRVAALPGVRRALLQRQRDFRQPPGLVADGRDMGSVVFPDAQVKIFLTATPQERARRRHKQLKEKGFDVSLSNLSNEIAERDRRDASRAAAPLKPANDAVELDTTGLGIEEVVERVLERVRRRPV